MPVLRSLAKHAPNDCGKRFIAAAVVSGHEKKHSSEAKIVDLASDFVKFFLWPCV